MKRYEALAAALEALQRYSVRPDAENPGVWYVPLLVAEGEVGSLAEQLGGAVSRVEALEEALDLAGARLGEYRDYDGTREVEDALGRPIGGQ